MTNTDHTYVPESDDDYISIHNGKPIKLIYNPNFIPGLVTKQKHVIFLPRLCEKSNNPLPESFIEISYVAGIKFIEVFSLEAYINAFINHPIVRDVEYLTQEIAKEVATLLGIEVFIDATYKLNRLRQEIITQVHISNELANSLRSTYLAK